MTDDDHSSPIQFPCDFAVKAMGKNDDTFKEVVNAAIATHFPEFDLSTLKERPSKDSTYLAITATVHASSQSELDALYTELTANPQVLMAL